MLPAGAGFESRSVRVSQPSVAFSRLSSLSSLDLKPRAREGQRKWSSRPAIVSSSHGCSSCDPFRLRRDSVAGSRGGRFDIKGGSCSRYRLGIGRGSSPRRPMSAEAAARPESSVLSFPVSSASAMNGTVTMNGGLGLSPDRARSGTEVSGRTSSSIDAEERWRVNGSAEACVATILVTGGAGYIGSHTCVQLLEEGYRVVVVDNLDNSSEEAVRRVAELAGSRGENLTFFKVDLCDRQTLEELFTFVRFDAVIHFAGLKAVGESVRMPLRYYRNNIEGTLNLAELMAAHNCKKMVFSSSATVYGQPQHVPCREDDTMQTLNPYARTKLYIENIMRDVQVSDPEWRIVLLRYFNPVAAHPSGRIGEDPRGIPNNLMPFIQQVAVGRRPFLSVFGSDYPTRDGTGVRDFVHVMDLASGHTAALRKIFRTRDMGCEVYNLGTGRGTSVLEMVAAFEKASGVKLTVKLCPRREGDAGEVFAATAKAEKELDWKAKYNVDDMCRDQWNWAKNNPWGYARGPEEEEEEEEEERSGGRGQLEQRQFGEANVELGRLGHGHAHGHEHGLEDERVRCAMTTNRVSLVSLGSMEEES